MDHQQDSGGAAKCVNFLLFLLSIYFIVRSLVNLQELKNSRYLPNIKKTLEEMNYTIEC